ncbi:MAG: HPr family phosphocarrier protein [Eubacteriales bacterium]|nr:HPr family phosphocarrier protein [Eubacteriales bacterium]
MRQFQYVIKDSMGMHARPVAELAQVISDIHSDVLIEYKSNTVSAKNMMKLLSLGVRYGEEIRVIITGEDEDKDYKRLMDFFRKNL